MSDPHPRRRTSPYRLAVRAGLVVVAAIALAGCSGDDAADPPESSPPASPTAAGEPPEAPDSGACYALTFDQALAPTARKKPVPCDRAHTSETYDVGRLDLVADGHLLAVDSDRAQAQVAAACPAALPRFLGGDVTDLRLSMIRPVWFTPTLAQSDRGADWYRCDAVVVAGGSTLAEVTGSLRGVLGREEGRDAYAMCGTAAPDDEGFERVRCSADHSWRAVSVVTFPAGDYPGEDAARARGQVPCENRGLEVADDPLDYEWGYEWPTAEQWQAGMTFGRCWAPDPS